MGIVRICCLFVGLNWTISSFPQSYFPIVQKNGIWFHEVSIREGMTLFSIAQDLNATSTQIKTDNPGLTDNIQIGSKVFVRASKSTFNYSAIKGDTPFGIAKKFGLTLDSLIAFNPSLKNGVNVNQIVLIKNGIKRYVDADLSNEESSSSSVTDSTERNYRTFEFSDSVINYVVKPGEKLTVISKRFLLSSAKVKAYNKLSSNTVSAGTVLKIPLKRSSPLVAINPIPQRINEEPKIVSVTTNNPLVPNKTSKPLRIGVFLPFNRDSLIFPLKGMQKFAVDFYMGTLAAIDSLSNDNIKGDVYYFDYRSKEERIDALITAGKLDRFDIFIGPLHVQESEVLAQFAQTKRIPLVLPLPTMATSMQQNEFVFCVATELKTQAILMAQHLASEQHSTSIALYKSNLPADTLIEQIFLSEFYANAPKNARIIIANETTAKGLLKSNVPITCISFSQDKKQVLSLVKQGMANPNIELFGPREWTEWKEINSSIDNPSNFKYVSTTCFDLDHSRTKNFHKAFRVRFESDLTKAVLLGYDILYSVIPWYFNGDNHKYGLMAGFQYAKTVGLYHVNFGGKICHFSNFKSVVDVNR